MLLQLSFVFFTPCNQFLFFVVMSNQGNILFLADCKCILETWKNPPYLSMESADRYNLSQNGLLHKCKNIKLKIRTQIIRISSEQSKSEDFSEYLILTAV